MSQAEITMRSGATVRFDCNKLTIGKSPLGGLASVKWEAGPDGYGNRSALHIDVDEIAAVIWIDQ